MATKKIRPSLSAMEEFDLEAKIQKATEDRVELLYNEEKDFKKTKKPLEKRTTAQYVEKEKQLQKKRLGRPKKNPYSEEKKLTIRMPEALHRQLRFASADTGKPMVEIAVDALIKYLIDYKNQ